jgi:hypothetical protein
LTYRFESLPGHLDTYSWRDNAIVGYRACVNHLHLEPIATNSPRAARLVKSALLLFLLTATTGSLAAQQLFINASSGLDTNPGTHEHPLKSLTEAARRVNTDTTSKSSEVILAPGLYVLSQTALFQTTKPYSETDRLVIRAEILPDDPAWQPQLMPTVVTAAPLVSDVGGESANGIQIEVNHATVQGLRFMGGLDFYYKGPSELRRTYPIWRGGKNLVDLLVKQCVFMGDEQTLPLHVGVIANGHGLVLEHDVFYNVRNAVVFWTAEGGTSHHNAMRNCLVYGASVSGIWTVETDGGDFDFRNNVIANSRTAWIREQGGSRRYKAVASLFADNANMAAYGRGPVSSFVQTDTSFLTMQDMPLSGKVDLVMDRSQRDYLHIRRGSAGYEVQAGLFSKH